MPRVGLISDTHGSLDARATRVLCEQGVVAIVHAGDIGSKPSVLWDLEAIAPVTAVLGNCDAPLPGFALSGLARTTVAGVRILVIHAFADLGEIPDDVDVVVYGHSHMPSVQWHGRVLVVNPGSASQRRRMPSTSIAILDIADEGLLDASVVMLDDATQSAE